jgi:16S rRNA (guanine966-N2)-methyltransferase
MIRIIAGIYKGRFLKVPNAKVTRPTMDKVRQAMFSAMKDKVVNSVTLDLFTGSGAMGIEALSRGAKKAYFNDKDRQTYRLMTDNIKELEIPEEQYEACNMDFRLFLKKHKDVQFDVVFLDPPYRFNINADIIKDMEKNNQFASKALIISEQDYKNPEIEGFEMKEYRYGEKYVALYYRKD